ncbi:MAG: tRNA synthetase class II (D K and N) [Bacteroidetes bacterium]|nr:MAG: tRNA synthetase class II (D K and N) [Bacteroidota bacterium]
METIISSPKESSGQKKETGAVQKALSHAGRKELADILRVQQCIIRATHEFMFRKNLVQVMPLLLSPITDPLNHGVIDAAVAYAGQRWSLTKSMIFHKQLALTNPMLEAIYIVSPNVRLELDDRRETGRHLFEFTQVDFEFRDKDMDFVMEFMEELVRFIFVRLNVEMSEELQKLRGSVLPVPGKFRRYRTETLEELYGDQYEMKKSKESIEPFWLINHAREFYDREEPLVPGTYRNYDIIWPDGFGEGLSGAEREYDYEQILKRMKETGTDEKVFAHYLEVVKAGLLPRSAGAGFGVERMTRYVCGLKDVDDATVFSRKPWTAPVF